MVYIINYTHANVFVNNISHNILYIIINIIYRYVPEITYYHSNIIKNTLFSLTY